MNRTEFVKAVAEKAEMTQKSVKEVLEVMQEVTFEEMAEQGEVKLFDGVTLIGEFKEARTARNPLTGEAVDVPAKVAPRCKFGKAIKDALNA